MTHRQTQCHSQLSRCQRGTETPPTLTRWYHASEPPPGTPECPLWLLVTSVHHLTQTV